MTAPTVRIPREEFPARRAALSTELERLGLDGWIACGTDGQFAGGDHVRYLTDFAPHFEPVFVLGRGARSLVLTGAESLGLAAPVVRETGTDCVAAIQELAHPGLEYASIPLSSGGELIAELFQGASRIGLLGGGEMTIDAHRAVIAPLAERGLALVAADETAYRLRAVKSPAEHAVIDNAYRIAVVGMGAARSALARGADEREAAAAADAAMRGAGAEGPAIETMVGSGPNSASILARSTPRRPAADEVVAVTLAPRVEGYCVCVARPFLRGSDPAVEQAVAIAWEAQLAAVGRLAPGRPGADGTRAAREVVGAARTGAAIDEVWVHSMGLIEFEPPFMGPRSGERLEPGMAISVDVPLFGAPWGGLRIEDGFVIDEAGVRPRLSDRENRFPLHL